MLNDLSSTQYSITDGRARRYFLMSSIMAPASAIIVSLVTLLAFGQSSQFPDVRPS
jgi:hypothetical protein